MKISGRKVCTRSVCVCVYDVCGGYISIICGNRGHSMPVEGRGKLQLFFLTFHPPCVRKGLFAVYCRSRQPS